MINLYFFAVENYKGKNGVIFGRIYYPFGQDLPPRTELDN
jgi:hypothetical protein